MAGARAVGTMRALMPLPLLGRRHRRRSWKGWCSVALDNIGRVLIVIGVVVGVVSTLHILVEEAAKWSVAGGTARGVGRW